MNYEIINLDGKTAVSITAAMPSAELDISDIISLCFEHNSQAVIFENNSITENFINLRTGLAGEMIQKLINYHIKAAAVIDKDRELGDRFRELILEYNKSNNIRFYHTKEDAVNWIFETGKN